jgi:salicylate 5-hydroxylase large subunit
MPTHQSSASHRKWVTDDQSRVPYWVYTDDDIYQQEQAKIFAGSSWNYLALSAEIPEPGDFKKTTVGDKPIVVNRDKEGELHAFVNRCAHRGVMFCQHETGNADEFMCPYHQWVYDQKGALVGVPFRRGIKRQGGMPKDFKFENHGLETLKVTERNGVIFGSFDHDMEVFDDYMGPSMMELFERIFDGRKLKVLGYMRQRTPANWKLMFENIKDPYHASLLHVFLVTFGLFRADQPSQVKMDDTGRHGALISSKGEQAASDATAEMKSFKSDMTLNDPNLLTPVKEFPGSATVVMHTIWPNLIIQQQSNTLAMRQLVTRGPNAFDLHWTFFGYADDTEEMTNIRLRQANLMGPAGLVSIDDSEVMEASQMGISPFEDVSGVLEMGGKDVQDEDHMVTEAAIRGFYKYYREVMGL